MTGETVQLQETMWCPYCLGQCEHRLFVNDDGIVQWCQHCFRVHLYELRTSGVGAVLVRIPERADTRRRHPGPDESAGTQAPSGLPFSRE